MCKFKFFLNSDISFYVTFINSKSQISLKSIQYLSLKTDLLKNLENTKNLSKTLFTILIYLLFLFFYHTKLVLITF